MMLFSLSNLLWTALSLIYASSTFYLIFPSLYSTAVRYKRLTVNDQGKAHFNSSIQIACNYDVFSLFRYYFKGAGSLTCN